VGLRDIDCFLGLDWLFFKQTKRQSVEFHDSQLCDGTVTQSSPMYMTPSQTYRTSEERTPLWRIPVKRGLGESGSEGAQTKVGRGDTFRFCRQVRTYRL